MLAKYIYDQPSACSFLEGILTTGRWPKALVFYGPSGVGKTHTAHTLGYLALEKPSNASCPDYKMYREGTHPELMYHKPSDGYTGSELKSRKTRPTWRIQHIRELLKHLREPLLYGKRRTVVFSDFDHFPPGQFAIADAFLKVLEEGMENTTIILTTSSLESLPSALISRMTPVLFTPLTLPTVESLLDADRDDPDAHLAMRLGQGSLTRTRELLERSEGLSCSQIQARAFRLLSLLPKTGIGKVFSFLGVLSDEELGLFMLIFKDILKDILLRGSEVPSRIVPKNQEEVLINLTSTYLEYTDHILKDLMTLEEVLAQQGIRSRVQIFAFILKVKRHIQEVRL